MTSARIYKPAKTAMQSGKAKTQRWLLEFDQASPRSIEPLMGWVSSADTRQQLKLWFDSKEEAISYATRNGIAFRVEEEAPARKRVGVSYSDNFRHNRVGSWTH